MAAEVVVPALSSAETQDPVMSAPALLAISFNQMVSPVKTLMNVSLGHTTVGLDKPVSIHWDPSAASGTRAVELVMNSQMTVVAKILTNVRLVLITAPPILSVRILQDLSVADPSYSA